MDTLVFVVATPSGARRITGSEIKNLTLADHLHVWVQKDHINKLEDDDKIAVINSSASELRKTTGSLVKATFNGENKGLDDAVFQISSGTDVNNVLGKNLSGIASTDYIHVAMPFDNTRLYEVLDADSYLIADDSGTLKKVDGLSFLQTLIPQEDIGTVTIIGPDTVLKSQTGTYTAEHTGSVDSSNIVYNWTSSKGLVQNTGRTVDIKYTQEGTDNLSCRLESPGTSDKQVTASKTVDVTTKTIGSVSITGPTSPYKDVSSTYTVTAAGDAADLTYQWEISGGTDLTGIDLTGSSITITWDTTGTHTVKCTVQSVSSSDSPRVVTESILVLPSIPIGDWTMSGDTDVEYKDSFTYKVNTTNGEATDYTYTWSVTNGTKGTVSGDQVSVTWDKNVGAGKVQCIIGSAQATDASTVTVDKDVTITKTSDITVTKGTIVPQNAGDRFEPNVTIRPSNFSYSNNYGTVTETYEWFKDGVSLGTSNTYTLQTADVGSKITVKYTATDSLSSTADVTSDEIEVLPYNPINLNPGTIAGTTTVGNTLTLTGTSVTGAVGTTIFAREWKRDGENTVLSTGSTYKLVSADEGKQLYVNVSVTDSNNNTAEEDTSLTSTIGAPNVNVNAGSVKGNLKVGASVTVDPSASGGLAPYTFSYKWMHTDGSSSLGTSKSYTVKSSDKGKTLKCEVTATDYNGYTGTSTATAGAPVSDTLVVIPGTVTGSTDIGKTLSISSSSYSGGAAPVTFTNRWEHEDAPGASLGSGSTYVTKNSDSGKKIRVSVTAKDAGNEEDTKYSNAIGPVYPVFTITSFGALTRSGNRFNAGAYTYSGRLGDGEPTASYYWHIGSAPAFKSTLNYYDLKSEDTGKTIKVVLELEEPSSNHPTTPRKATSTSNSLVANKPADLSVVAGAIDPSTPTSLEWVTTKESTATGGVDGDSFTFSYKWTADDGSNLGTSRGFYVPGSMIGKKIKCTVSSTTSSGASGSDTTAWSGNVKAHTLEWTKTGEVTYTSPIRPGQTLGHGGFTVVGGESPYTWSYRWEDNSGRHVGTDTTYKVRSEDVGKKLRRITTVTDKWGILLSHTAAYTPTVDYDNITVNSWGSWSKRYVNPGETAKFTVTSLSGGTGNYTRNNKYRSYRITNQIAVDHYGGGSTTIFPSDSQLRQMAVTRDVDKSRHTVKGGTTNVFEVFHRGSSKGDAVYTRRDSKNGSDYYADTPRAIAIKLRSECSFWDIYAHEFHIKNKSNGDLIKFSKTGIVGGWDCYVILKCDNRNKTEFEIFNNKDGDDRKNIKVYGMFVCNWSDWVHTNRTYDTWPALNYMYNNGWVGGDEPDSSKAVKVETNSSGYNKKLPEGHMHVSVYEDIDTNGYGKYTNGQWWVGLGYNNSTEGINAACAQMEISRIGSAHVRSPLENENTGLETYVNGVPVTNTFDIPEDPYANISISVEGDSGN